MLFNQRKKAIPVIITYGQGIVINGYRLFRSRIDFSQLYHIRTMDADELLFVEQVFKVFQAM